MEPKEIRIDVSFMRLGTVSITFSSSRKTLPISHSGHRLLALWALPSVPPSATTPPPPCSPWFTGPSSAPGSEMIKGTQSSVDASYVFCHEFQSYPGWLAPGTGSCQPRGRRPSTEVLKVGPPLCPHPTTGHCHYLCCCPHQRWDSSAF